MRHFDPSITKWWRGKQGDVIWGSHHADLVIRCGGKDWRFEADWVRHTQRALAALDGSISTPPTSSKDMAT